jgi:hypothetical protein
MKPVLLLVFSLGVLLLHASAFSLEDWESCESDLNDVRQSAADAAGYAFAVQSKASELRECLNDSDGFDLIDDHCSIVKSEFEESKDKLRGQMDALNGRLSDVESSCHYNFNAGSAAPHKWSLD